MMSNKIWIWIIFALFLLFLPTLARCEEICIDKDIVSEITIDLEKCKITEHQLDLIKQQNSELEKQIQLLNDVIQLKDRQLQAENEAFKRYSELLKDQKNLYEEAIKKSKPSLFKSITNGLGAIGIGILIGVLLI